MSHSCIHWFRKGLRLHDNPALLAALRDCRRLYPIFILDPWFAAAANVGINRWRFLVGALKDLDRSLRELDSRLFVVRGKPSDVFPELFREWSVTRLTFETDTEPYSQQRDKEVLRLAEEHGVEVIQKISHTLYNIERSLLKPRVPVHRLLLALLLEATGGICQPDVRYHPESNGQTVQINQEIEEVSPLQQFDPTNLLVQAPPPCEAGSQPALHLSDWPLPI
ncbi:cryptochrome-2-like [Denticeps clupeoides]|uniref:cryptochrome-2-like n=1 Tax=Denticeps clupeoides TaxID=299321 RepID=UPI0010A51282|nr:cryptochrome-2-like [Denticeps clupeoides]